MESLHKIDELGQKAHTVSPNCLMQMLGATSSGLSEEQSRFKLAAHGLNELPCEEPKSLLRMILHQFEDLLVRILLIAAVVSFVLGYFDEQVNTIEAFIEPTVIIFILIANAAVGVWQEKSAESAIQSLKEYESESARVIRSGSLRMIDAKLLVPGDLVEVSVGDRVPADIRILQIRSSVFRVDQSILTGESVAVNKTTGPIADACALRQDRHNCVFAGTSVTSGMATGIVIGTGLNTAIGRIHKEIESYSREKTPLQQKIDDFSQLLSRVIFVLCVAVWLMNIRHFGDDVHGGSVMKGAIYYLKIAIALAVAAIPEGLPAVITACLALGMRRMAKKNAIIRNLRSVETLGCTSVICSDKTGTLTTNKMTISKMFTVAESSTGELAFSEYEVTGDSYAPTGRIYQNGSEVDCKKPELVELATICVMCNDASIYYDEKLGTYEKIGEATEAALLVLAEKMSKCQGGREISCQTTSYDQRIKQQWQKVLSFEFTHDRKSMSTFCRPLVPTHSSKTRIFVKGAPENLLSRSSYLRVGDSRIVITEGMSQSILQRCRSYGTGRDALRCIALGTIDEPTDYTQLNLSPEDFINYEKNITFVGVVGMLDPPREGVRSSIDDCHNAGIRVIMITGDNKDTAEAIGRKVGLFGEWEDTTGKSFNGLEFNELSPDLQRGVCRQAKLFARVEPSHKSRIVECLQSHGEIVAMTGDGVNDAPALKKADIGIAMGSGTAVAKSSSEMILADDNFSTIASAVEEGRAIYNNMRQLIRYLISSNIGEVVAIFLVAALGIPENLTPIQLLWMNLVTDGFPATALGFNPPDGDIMKKKPRKSSEPLISKWLFLRYLVIGCYVGFATVGASLWWFKFSEGGPHVDYYQLTNWMKCGKETKMFKGIDCSLLQSHRSNTMALSVLVVIEMLNAFNSLSESQSLLTFPPTRNYWLCASVVFSLILHLAILHVEVLARIFQVEALGYQEWIIVLVFSAPVILLDEAMKCIARRCCSTEEIELESSEDHKQV